MFKKLSLNLFKTLIFTFKLSISYNKLLLLINKYFFNYIINNKSTGLLPIISPFKLIKFMPKLIIFKLKNIFTPSVLKTTLINKKKKPVFISRLLLPRYKYNRVINA